MFRRALLSIQEHGKQAREELSRLEQEFTGGHAPAAMLAQHLVEIGGHLARIEETVHAFRLDSPGEKQA
jgi:hypothetical protein